MTKRFITLLLALTMVFACAVPVMADDDLPDGSYIQGDEEDYEIEGEFTVTLTIQSHKVSSHGPICYYYLPVTLGEEDESDFFTVADVLDAAADQYTNLSFLNGSLEPMHQGSYLYAVQDTDVWTDPFTVQSFYQSGTTCYYGWMFRINGMIPMVNASTGALLNQAYVQENDNITLYFATIESETVATRSTKIMYLGSYNGVQYFRLIESHCYASSGTGGWTITDYDYLANESVTIVVDGYTNNPITYTGTTNDYGIIGFTSISGTHTIELRPKYVPVTKNNIQYYIPTHTGDIIGVNFY